MFNSFIELVRSCLKYHDADTVKIGKISQSWTYHANRRRNRAVTKEEERANLFASKAREAAAPSQPIDFVEKDLGPMFEEPGAMQEGIVAQPEDEDQPEDVDQHEEEGFLLGADDLLDEELDVGSSIEEDNMLDVPDDV